MKRATEHGQPLEWLDLSRVAVQEFVPAPFDELCYVGVVKALADCAGENSATPKHVSVAFSRKPDKTLQVHAKATYNGEWFDYSAILPDHWDREFTGQLQ